MGDPLPVFDDFGGILPPSLPWIPEAGRENEPPSKYVKRAVHSVDYPSLFIRESWTKSVPCRHTFEFFKPSETIGR